MLDPRQVARALNGEVTGSVSVNASGPGHSTRDRSLSIKIDARAPDGFIVFSHAGDNPIMCRDYVRQRLGLPALESCHYRDRQTPLAVTSSQSAEGESVKWALALWDQCVDPRRTLVEKYLASRGLELDPEIAGSVVRFHVALRVDGGTTAGMVALFRDIQTDAPCGIHRTFLDKDGRKVGRKMLGRAHAATIKLDDDTNVHHGLTIGEGIETCLAGRIAGFRPTWALGSAGAIGRFPVLAGIDCLTILGETDDDGANARAMKACARCWIAAGREVLAVTPKGRGDLNDVLREAQG